MLHAENRMPRPTPEQVRLRERFDGLIGLLAPALDLVLAAGDRISRIVGPDDEYYPIRPPGESFELAPASPPPDEPSADEGDSP
jgi:hypothetical protein